MQIDLLECAFIGINILIIFQLLFDIVAIRWPFNSISLFLVQSNDSVIYYVYTAQGKENAVWNGL